MDVAEINLNTVSKTRESEEKVERLGCFLLPCHQLWASLSNHLSLSFLIWEMGLMTAPPTAEWPWQTSRTPRAPPSTFTKRPMPFRWQAVTSAGLGSSSWLPHAWSLCKRRNGRREEPGALEGPESQPVPRVILFPSHACISLIKSLNKFSNPITSVSVTEF